MMRKAAMSTWRDVGLTALAPAIWRSAYLVASEWLPSDRPFTAALLRVLPTGMRLMLFTRHLPVPADRCRLAVLAVFNIGVFQALLFVAAYRLPGWSRGDIGNHPAIAGDAAGVDRQSPSLCSVAGMAVLLLSRQTVWEPVGISMCAACMASGTYFGRRWRVDIPVLTFTGWQLLIGGIMLVSAAWLVDAQLPRLTALEVSDYGYPSLASVLLANTLWFRGNTCLRSVSVAPLGLLSPLTAVILGWIVLGQSMSGTAMIGLVLVLARVLSVQWLAYRPFATPGRSG